MVEPAPEKIFILLHHLFYFIYTCWRR